MSLNYNSHALRQHACASQAASKPNGLERLAGSAGAKPSCLAGCNSDNFYFAVSSSQVKEFFLRTNLAGLTIFVFPWLVVNGKIRWCGPNLIDGVGWRATWRAGGGINSGRSMTCHGPFGPFWGLSAACSWYFNWAFLNVGPPTAHGPLFYLHPGSRHICNTLRCSLGSFLKLIYTVNFFNPKFWAPIFV